MHSTGELAPMPIHFGRRKLWIVEELRLWINAGCPNRDKWLAMKIKKIARSHPETSNPDIKHE
jgi:hypothetical protein